jgi:hypothetical protein
MTKGSTSERTTKRTSTKKPALPMAVARKAQRSKPQAGDTKARSSVPSSSRTPRKISVEADGADGEPGNGNNNVLPTRKPRATKGVRRSPQGTRFAPGSVAGNRDHGLTIDDVAPPEPSSKVVRFKKDVTPPPDKFWLPGEPQRPPKVPVFTDQRLTIGEVALVLLFIAGLLMVGYLLGRFA